MKSQGSKKWDTEIVYSRRLWFLILSVALGLLLFSPPESGAKPPDCSQMCDWDVCSTTSCYNTPDQIVTTCGAGWPCKDCETTCDDICTSTTRCHTPCKVFGVPTTCAKQGYSCTVEHCSDLPEFAQDKDCDGLLDSFEAALAAKFEPVYHYSSDERFWHGGVGPEGPVCANPDGCNPQYKPGAWGYFTIYYNIQDYGKYLQINYYTLFDQDKCPECFQNCEVPSCRACNGLIADVLGLYDSCCGHEWDTEHIALKITCANKRDASSCSLQETAYFRHDLPPSKFPAGYWPLYNGTHPRVYIQKGKHGSYYMGKSNYPEGYPYCGGDYCADFQEVPMFCRQWEEGSKYQVCGGWNGNTCRLVNVGEIGQLEHDGKQLYRNLVGWTNNSCKGERLIELWPGGPYISDPGKWGGASSVCTHLQKARKIFE
jgi:hypothetical protein